MISDLYWIETGDDRKLAIMARPRAGDWLEDEVANWKRQGVGVVVSLLEAHEVEDLGLQNESEMCSRMGIDFRSFPIKDRGVPSDVAAARKFVRHRMTRLLFTAELGLGDHL